MMEEWLRPVISALLIAGTFFAFDRSGILKDKPFWMRALILMPAFLVVILIYDVIWPLA